MIFIADLLLHYNVPNIRSTRSEKFIIYSCFIHMNEIYPGFLGSEYLSL
jgi:hypothetical protein